MQTIQKSSPAELTLFPKEWKVMKAIEIGTVTDGDWILEKEYSTNGVRLLQVGDIGIGKFIGKSKRFISKESANRLKCTLVNQGKDILISRMPDPIGRACLSPVLDLSLHSRCRYIYFLDS